MERRSGLAGGGVAGEPGGQGSERGRRVERWWMGARWGVRDVAAGWEVGRWAGEVGGGRAGG